MPTCSGFIIHLWLCVCGMQAPADLSHTRTHRCSHSGHNRRAKHSGSRPSIRSSVQGQSNNHKKRHFSGDKYLLSSRRRERGTGVVMGAELFAGAMPKGIGALNFLKVILLRLERQINAKAQSMRSLKLLHPCLIAAHSIEEGCMLSFSLGCFA